MGFQYTLSQLKNIAWLFYCDLIHVHHYAAGEHFEDIHGLSDHYLAIAYENMDYFAEKAIAKKESVTNGATIQQHVSDDIWMPETSTSYTLDQFIIFLRNKGGDYIEALKNARAEPDVKSKIDEMLDFWTSEIEYKNEQKSALEAAQDMTLTLNPNETEIPKVNYSQPDDIFPGLAV